MTQDGKAAGTKQAPEPCLREPSTPLERALMRQQQQRTSAAEVLQRSFQRKKTADTPLGALLPIRESAGSTAAKVGQTPQPRIFKHAANAMPGGLGPKQPGSQPGRPESLKQQQRRLANVASANQAVRVAAAHGARAPFRPLI